MNKKVLMCVPLPPPNGGITNWYKVVCNEASKKNIEFVIVNTSSGVDQEKRSLFHRVFVQGLQMLGMCIEILKKLKKNKDVFVAHITTSAQLALIRDILFLWILRFKKIKTVYHFHFGRTPDIIRNKSMEFKLLKIAVGIADSVITIDKRSYEYLKSLFANKDICYVPNPVPVISDKHNSSNKEVVYLGMVLKAKGIEELLTSWSYISKKHPDWNLKVVGACEESYYEFLNNNFEAEGVVFCGFVEHDQAMEILSKASFLVLPSHTEGFPNVVVEAMMCQKTVVATNVGAIDDMLSGNCGIVVEPKNVEELTNGIETLISNDELREEMSLNAKEKAINNYASDFIIDEYIRIWSFK